LPLFGSTNSTTMWHGPNYLMGLNQEAGFTVLSVDNLPAGPANDGNVVWEGLVLKANGTGPNTSYIEVRYSYRLQRVEVRTTTNNGATFQVRATYNNVILNPGDVFRAQALANGNVLVFRGTTPVGSPITVPGFGGGGAIGMRFSVPAPRSVRIDDFRGGNL
jgi:hypothetical protein